MLGKDKAATASLPDVDVAMYYQQIVAEAEGQILHNADVVCCTVAESRWTQLATDTVKLMYATVYTY